MTLLSRVYLIHPAVKLKQLQIKTRNKYSSGTYGLPCSPTVTRGLIVMFLLLSFILTPVTWKHDQYICGSCLFYSIHSVPKPSLPLNLLLLFCRPWVSSSQFKGQNICKEAEEQQCVWESLQHTEGPQLEFQSRAGEEEYSRQEERENLHCRALWGCTNNISYLKTSEGGMGALLTNPL